MMTKFEAALTYASWGWHVIPVVPNGKIPATQHGVKDATTEPEQIARWWAQNPEYNIGVAAGERSRLVVFDIDPRNGGNESWEQWTNEYGAPPDGLMQLTAGGGQHFVARYTPEIRSCKLSDGIDILADGRYFVAHPSSIDGRSYEWEASSDPFYGVAPFMVPTKWLDAYADKRKPTERHPSGAQGGALIQGSRNSGLTALGGAMRRYGMAEAEIMAALAIANETRCEIPLPSSELSQIVRSVARYAPDSDVAADAALGSEAADALLSYNIAETQEYFFTRATSFLGQPSPLRWVIKRWLPDAGVTMVYGDSGAGKTFVTLDMACCIASGSEWHGHKVKPGLVVYMAGEGNYGIRQRVASWCKAHDVHQLDNLLISNKAIDIDSPATAAHIINAVRELTNEDASMVFIDTLNNHMGGDENSAQDARNMLNAAQIVSRALGSAICINHHKGVSADAKHRARGSSAWKASLDAQILISKSDGLIEVSCTKMKDTEEPKAIFGRLDSIDLGWFDDDGEEIKGAVFAITNDVPKEAQHGNTKGDENARTVERAWWDSKAEVRNGSPYISRSALRSLLVKDGATERTATNKTEASRDGSLISKMLNAGVLEGYEHGWIFINPIQVSSMLMRKND